MIEVIVPNWNGMRVLPACLESLGRQTFEAFRVTVVDNGSEDESVAFVSSRFPGCRILRLPRNVGFSGAVNEGVRRSPADWIALLNNDAEAEPGWLEALHAAAMRHPRAGSFASKVLRMDRPGRLESAGDMLGSDACGVNRGRDATDGAPYDEEREVFSASAAAALYRHEVFRRVGLFDEGFFAYFEDVDLGFRAQRYGFRCIFVPGARVRHHGKFSRPADRAWHLRQEFVNSCLCQVKNLPARHLARNWLPVVAGHLRGLKGLVMEGGWDVLMRSEVGLLRGLPRALATRRALARACGGRFERLDAFLPRWDGKVRGAAWGRGPSP